MQAFRKSVLIPLLLAGSLFAWPVLAQRVPVVEAGSDQSQQPQARPLTQQGQNQPVSGNGQNEIMVNMYLQLEALQAEIQNLRGMVEEQSYQIRRMQTEQRDRYLDTDSRLGELYNQIQTYHGGQPITGQLPAGQAPGQQGTNPVTGNPVDRPSFPDNTSSISRTSNNVPNLTGGAGLASGAAVTGSSPQNEQGLYRQALNLLLEDEAFQDSITLFQQYMDVYPQGRYFTNALYWQGAALELVGNYNQAIVVLQRLINEYPEDAKAPTAMLRLGTVYREMGDILQAVGTWQRISEQFPDSASEIEIANEYLSEVSN